MTVTFSLPAFISLVVFLGIITLLLSVMTISAFYAIKFNRIPPVTRRGLWAEMHISLVLSLWGTTVLCLLWP